MCSGLHEGLAQQSGDHEAQQRNPLLPATDSSQVEERVWKASHEEDHQWPSARLDALPDVLEFPVIQVCLVILAEPGHELWRQLSQRCPHSPDDDLGEHTDNQVELHTVCLIRLQIAFRELISESLWGIACDASRDAVAVLCQYGDLREHGQYLQQESMQSSPEAHRGENAEP